jgi:hypothetical protein
MTKNNESPIVIRLLTQWHPASTPPEDGVRVLLYFNKWKHITIGQFDKNIWVDVDGDYIGPSHWMPLPNPPVG